METIQPASRKRKRKPKKKKFSLQERLAVVSTQYSSANVRSLESFGPRYATSTVVEWICPKSTCSHPHEWRATMRDRIIAPQTDCPFCCGKRICACLSFMNLNPELVPQYDPVKNGTLDPYTLSSYSHHRVYWICPITNCDMKCQHSWVAPVGSRSNGHGCPVCYGSKPCICRLFQTKHPELIKEWKFDENTHLDLSSIGCSSPLVATWICKNSICAKKCLHIWKVSISERTRGAGCPFCSPRGRQVCECNSLYGKFPLLMLEWSLENTIDPKRIKPGSRKAAKWVCGRCSWKWKASIYHRTVTETGCPLCRLSHGEKALANLLTELQIPFDAQYRMRVFNVVKKSPFLSRFDIYLPSFKAVIEFDGRQHFEVVERWGGQTRLEENIVSDISKNFGCRDKGLHLLRISFKEIKEIRQWVESFLSAIPTFVPYSINTTPTSTPVTSLFMVSNPELYEKQAELFSQIQEDSLNNL